MTSSRRTVAAAIAGVVAVATLGAQAPAPQSARGIDATRLAGALEWRPVGDSASGDLTSVVTDNAFPFRVCGNAVPTGPVCVSSRRERDAGSAWPAAPVVVDGGTTVRPDPNDADIVYGGNLTRYDRRIDQLVPIDPPRDGGFRALPASPILFAPDNKTLYYGANVLWRSTTGGHSWTPASPDLTRDGSAGAIAAIAFSAVAPRTIWAGTSDGLVQVTRDAGLTWTRTASPVDQPGAAIVGVEASHFDASSAYVVVRTAADATSLWRTRDDGATWTSAAQGLPASVHVVREDTLRRGLLLAGTNAGVFVSFDDGEAWQSLRLNMPEVAVRDLAIRDADLVVATGGRGFWMLPDISALRQVTADVLRASLFLFRPGAAWRMRATVSGSRAADDAVGGLDGVALSYLVGPEPPPTLTLEIIATTTGEVLRRFSSEHPTGSDNWLDRSPGLHRRQWDLRYNPVPVVDAAGQPTGRSSPGVRVLPNSYQVRLTAGARVLRQAVTIRLDPRVRASVADLTAGHALARTIDEKERLVGDARAGLAAPAAPAANRDRAAELARAAGALRAVAVTLQQFDGRPTPSVDAAAAAAVAAADAALGAGN